MIAYKLKSITPSSQAAHTVLGGMVKVIEAMLDQALPDEEENHE